MVMQIIVTEEVDRWEFNDVGCPVIDVDDYLAAATYFSLKNVQVINLCKHYSYSSVGYYCSLLAEARRHRVIPSVKSILDLSTKAMYSLDAVNLDVEVQKAFKKYSGKDSLCKITVMFGRCEEPGFSSLARRLFETFPYPLLQISFKKLDQWRITSIRPLDLQRLQRDEKPVFFDALKHYLSKRWRAQKKKPTVVMIWPFCTIQMIHYRLQMQKH